MFFCPESADAHHLASSAAACKEQQLVITQQTKGHGSQGLRQSAVVLSKLKGLSMQGEVRIDGYSVELPQSNARRAPPDHEGGTPDDCLQMDIDECKIGHDCLTLNDFDMVERGERAAKLVRALQAAQDGVMLDFVCVKASRVL